MINDYNTSPQEIASAPVTMIDQGFDHISIWRLGLAGLVIALLARQAAVEGVFGSDLSTIYFFLFILTHCGWLMLAAGEVYFARIRLRSILGRLPSIPDILTWLPGAVSAVGMSVTAFVVLDFVLAVLAPDIREMLRSMDSSSITLGTPLLELIIGFLIAPVIEEFVFRGVILRRLIFRRGPVYGIILSSVLFGVLHFQSPIGAMLVGVILAYAYLATGSLYVSIMLHAAHNALVSLLDYWVGDSYMKLDVVTGGELAVVIILTALSVCFWLWWLRKRDVAAMSVL